MSRKEVTLLRFLPKGKYYIGDPCYVIADPDWIPLLESTGYFGLPDEEVTNWDEGKFQFRGKSAWAHGTAYGDGCYADNKGNDSYGVDAGLLSAIPVEICDCRDGVSLDSYGHVFDFDEAFGCYYDNGTFHFGDVTIKTGDERFDFDEDDDDPF